MKVTRIENPGNGKIQILFLQNNSAREGLTFEGLNKMAAIIQMRFSNGFSSKKTSEFVFKFQ